MPIIGICGDTASGKSTIAKNIKNLFSEKGAVIILSDSYYKTTQVLTLIHDQK